jgi:hypothetical protein
MQATRQEAYSFPPRVFKYSLDWRFLLPVADLSKGCLVFEEDMDFSQTLEYAGISASQRLSFSDFKIRNRNCLPFSVIPFGLPSSWVGTRSEDRVEFYVSIRHFLETGGYLLVGFNNSLSWRAHRGTKYHSSTPHRVRNELVQAGFKTVELFGAMPDLQIPEYIFQLDSRTLRFGLQNRFRRKPAVLRVLRVLDGINGWKGISHFLPCYFAVATA